MKKVISLLLLLLFIVSTGCEAKNDAKSTATIYLDKYINLDDEVINQLDEYIAKEELEESQKQIYKEILKRQYQELTYEVISEEYEGDEATINVKIKVYDLHKVGKVTTTYLETNQKQFNDENGNYNKIQYLSYRLDQMKNTTETVEYIIPLFASKTDGTWIINQPSKTVLEKIHGIYNYERR